MSRGLVNKNVENYKKNQKNFPGTPTFEQIYKKKYKKCYYKKKLKILMFFKG